MTVLESLKNRASLILSGGISFIVVIGAMRLSGGEPLLQPGADLGIVVGLALVTVFLVLRDLRGAKG